MSICGNPPTTLKVYLNLSTSRWDRTTRRARLDRSHHRPPEEYIMHFEKLVKVQIVYRNRLANGGPMLIDGMEVLLEPRLRLRPSGRRRSTHTTPLSLARWRRGRRRQLPRLHVRERCTDSGGALCTSTTAVSWMATAKGSRSSATPCTLRSWVARAPLRERRPWEFVVHFTLDD